MRLCSLLFICSLAVQFATSGHRASAQDEAARAEPSEEAKQSASGHFRRGVELFTEGAYRAALVEFEKANEILPDYRLLYNIGQTKLALQDYLGATLSYESYLSGGGADIPAARREDVERQLDALRERVGRVSIAVNADGADILIDDLAIGTTPLDGTIPVNVGRHRVFARGRDGSTATQVIDVAGGELVEVKLELTAPEVTGVAGTPVSETPPMSTTRKAAIGAWAGAGAAAVGAVVLGVMAGKKADDLDAKLGVVGSSRSEVNDLRDSADTLALTSDVFSGLAIAAGVAGVVLWFMEPDDSEESATAGDNRSTKQVSVKWGVGPTSVFARGHF